MAPILIGTPIVIPEKSFDKFWCASIVISSPSPTNEVSAEILLLPSNSAGETYEPGIQKMSVSGIMAKVQANPTGNFAKALYFIMKAVAEEKLAQDAAIAEAAASHPDTASPGVNL